jgi:predicted ferric reductase
VTDPRAPRALACGALYVAGVLAPLVAAACGSLTGASRGWTAEAGAAAGMVAFGVVAWEVVLVARLRAASAPFGTDALMLFHRQLGQLAVLFVLAHAVALGGAWNPFRGPPAARWGAAAAWAALLLVTAARWRRRLPLRYGAWRHLHGALALLLVVAMLAHALLAGHYARSNPVVRALLVAGAAAFVAFGLHDRLLRPLALRRRPWEVVSARPVGGDVTLLVLRPVGHAGLRFEPGQFAWLSIGRSPLTAEQHPLSIASSAAPAPDGRLEFAVKALGDWSRDVVPRLAPGTRAWVDGPYGAFSPDRVQAEGFVLVAGGIGLAPLRSVLLTFADRGERRPVTLVLAARNRARTFLGGELAALARQLPLRIVHVFEEPEPGAEQGYVTAALLARLLPPPRERLAFLVCGPGPMMAALERELRELGVAPAQVLTERFDMV